MIVEINIAGKKWGWKTKIGKHYYGDVHEYRNETKEELMKIGMKKRKWLLNKLNK